jgi:hypothetical protein
MFKMAVQRGRRVRDARNSEHQVRARRRVGEAAGFKKLEA